MGVGAPEVTYHDDICLDCRLEDRRQELGQQRLVSRLGVFALRELSERQGSLADRLKDDRPALSVGGDRFHDRNRRIHAIPGKSSATANPEHKLLSPLFSRDNYRECQRSIPEERM